MRSGGTLSSSTCGESKGGSRWHVPGKIDEKNRVLDPPLQSICQPSEFCVDILNRANKDKLCSFDKLLCSIMLPEKKMLLCSKLCKQKVPKPSVDIVGSLNVRRAVAATSFPLTIMISALLSTIPVTG